MLRDPKMSQQFTQQQTAQPLENSFPFFRRQVSRLLGSEGVLQTRLGLFLLVASIVFLSRIPFLGDGYGTHPDAWRVANAASLIAKTGHYSASRFPGYPFQEIVYALIPWKSPLVFNGLTALLSSLGIASFALVLRRLKCTNVLLFSFAVAGIPVIFTNSVVSLDYLWALSFALISLLLLLENRIGLSAVFLGLAIACRITSAALLIPYLFLVRASQDKHPNTLRILTFSAVSIFIGALFFFPVLDTYGLAFLQYYQSQYPSALYVVKAATVEIFGMAGCGALLIVIFVSVGGKHRVSSFPECPPKLRTALTQVSIVICAIYALLFLALPAKPAYLIPAVPFFLLLLGFRIRRTYFAGLCVILTLSSLLLSAYTVSGTVIAPSSSLAIHFSLQGRDVIVDPLVGPILHKHRLAIVQQQYISRVISRSMAPPRNSVVVAGAWLPQLAVTLQEPIDAVSPCASFVRQGVTFTELLSQQPDTSRHVFFLSQQQAYNQLVTGLDLSGIGATEIQF